VPPLRGSHELVMPTPGSRPGLTSSAPDTNHRGTKSVPTGLGGEQDARLQFEAAATKAKAKKKSGHSMLCPYERRQRQKQGARLKGGRYISKGKSDGKGNGKKLFVGEGVLWRVEAEQVAIGDGVGGGDVGLGDAVLPGEAVLVPEGP